MQHYTRMRDLREDADLTQEQLCRLLYMNKTTYTNYEQGKHTVPFDFAVTLAEFYGISLDYLAGLTNSPHGRQNPDLTGEQLRIAEQFSLLTEKNKGRLELYLEQLLEKQNNPPAERSLP